MATLTAYKQSRQLTFDAVLAEAIRETTPTEICARCIYRRRPCCRDETPAERSFCPVVQGILSGDGDGITCLTDPPRRQESA